MSKPLVQARRDLIRRHLAAYAVEVTRFAVDAMNHPTIPPETPALAEILDSAAASLQLELEQLRDVRAEHPKGASAGHPLLTEEQVRAIRAAPTRLSQRRLAAEYGVSRHTIADVRAGITHKRVV